MKTIKCALHDMLIIVLNPHEEYVFADDLMATVVFRDAKVGPYLKRYMLGKCDEDCPIVKKIFERIEAAVVEEDR